MQAKQITLDFEERIETKSYFRILPRYKKAFLVNAFWIDCVASFLCSKGNYNLALQDIETITCDWNDLLRLGYQVIHPSEDIYKEYRKVPPKIVKQVKIRSMRAPLELSQIIDI